MNFHIEDNFLDNKEFDYIKSLIDSPFFPWYYQNGRDFENDNFFQFVHTFYANHKPNSLEFDHLKPFIDKLNVKSLLRIKANINGRDTTPQIGHYHIDFPDCVTAIWYLNTNNGKTVFENGDEVNSVANRMVIFNSNIKHTAITHTDENVRIVLNFNFTL